MKIIKFCKSSARRGFRNMITGRSISSEFFKRNFFATGLIIFLCVGIIALRFDCVTSMEQIKQMNKQIEAMRTYKQRERARYMTLTRESAMQHTVDSLGLGLSIPEQYPLAIHYAD